MKYAYVGCRTTKARNARGNGLVVYEIQPDGSWNEKQCLFVEDNPSYQCLDLEQKYLYSVHGDLTLVSSYEIQADGTLRHLNTIDIGGKNPVDVTVDAANQNLFGDRKNTVKNIERTGEFVYNMVSYDLKDAMNASSIAKLPEGYADKFEYSGVTKAPSERIDVARVAESPIQYECKYVTTFRLPANGGISTIDCIVGEVIGIHIKDEVFTPDGKVDICKIRPVARLGYFDYTVVEKSFEMPAPRVSAKDQILVDKGLEGKV